MKRFIVNVLIVCFAACISLVACSYMVNTYLKRADFRLSNDKHIVVFGPSTSGCAINPDIIPGMENLSKDGSNIRWDLVFLPRLIDENPQIDTVLISLGRYSGAFNPFSVPNSIQWMRSILPAIIYDLKANPWSMLNENLNFYLSLLSPIDENKVTGWISDTNIKDYLYCPHNIDRNNLHIDYATWGVSWYDRKCEEHGDNIYSQQEIEQSNYELTKCINEAISYCKQKGITPVIFQPPLYQYDRWVNPEGYYSYLRDNFDGNILISDYENFVFPDDSYYGDVHHLNKYGSEYFSKHIAKNGLKLTTLSEYLDSVQSVNN